MSQVILHEHIPIIGQQGAFATRVKLLEIALIIRDKINFGVFFCKLRCPKERIQLASSNRLRCTRQDKMHRPQQFAFLIYASKAYSNPSTPTF